jgi:SAM-dependent methyltransferase
MSAPTSIFADQTFHPGEEHLRRFVEFVVAAVERTGMSNPRILEIGCGNGELLLRLLARLPGSRGLGLDISAGNIALAQAQLASASPKPEARFVHGDYFTCMLAQYDLVVSHTTLHLIPGDEDKLFGKIAGEMAPGGSLVISMPYDTFGNRLLNRVRQGLRAVRCGPLESAIFAAAKLVHGKKYPDDQLRERVIYNFIPVCRFYSPKLAANLRAKWGLEVLDEYTEETRLGKPAHKYIHLRKEKGGQT